MFERLVMFVKSLGSALTSRTKGGPSWQEKMGNSEEGRREVPWKEIWRHILLWLDVPCSVRWPNPSVENIDGDVGTMITSTRRARCRLHGSECQQEGCGFKMAFHLSAAN